MGVIYVSPTMRPMGVPQACHHSWSESGGGRSCNSMISLVAVMSKKQKDPLVTFIVPHPLGLQLHSQNMTTLLPMAPRMTLPRLIPPTPHNPTNNTYPIIRLITTRRALSQPGGFPFYLIVSLSPSRLPTLALTLFPS